MTIKVAIKTLETLLTHTQVDTDYAYDDADGAVELVPGQDIADALGKAISALHTQQGREQGCPVCNENAVLAWDMIGDGIGIEGNGKLYALSGGDWETDIAYCPKCGRRLSAEKRRKEKQKNELEV